MTARPPEDIVEPWVRTADGSRGRRRFLFLIVSCICKNSSGFVFRRRGLPAGAGPRFKEAEIEPDEIQLGEEYTRKIFTRRERGHGNRIYFEAANLQYASMQTKLGLQAMVDRGALTPNEWRAVLNLAPLPGGDNPIRRLDTQPTEESGGDED